MSVVKFTGEFRRPTELKGREIWDQAEGVTDLMAWEVCPYLRNLAPCQGCPEWQTEEFDGETFTSKIGCRALAEEACRVVLAAKARGS